MLSVEEEEEVEVGQQPQAKLSNIRTCALPLVPVPACAITEALESHSMFGIPPDIGKQAAAA